jgi:hypothetical protein
MGFWGNIKLPLKLINLLELVITFFSANARSSGYSLRRGKMIWFIGKPDRKPYNT